MLPPVNKPISGGMPRQMIPLKDKMEDQDEFGNSLWSRECMDSLEAIGRMQFFNNLKLKENYEIIQGRFILEHYLQQEDYFDISSAISQEFQLPKYLKHYDITSKAVNLLVGEYLKRPDIFRVIASDEATTNERIRLKTELVQSYMQGQVHQEITNKLIQMGIDPDKQDFKSQDEADEYKKEIEQKYQEMTPEAIEKYMKYDFRTSAESWGEAVLTNDKERFNTRELEKTEFTDMLVAARCFRHFYLVPTGYSMEYWNPLNTFLHMSPEVPNAEDGNWIGRTFYMAKAQVLDRLGWRMKEEQQLALYPAYDKKNPKDTGYSSMFQTNIYPFQNYDQFKGISDAMGAAVGWNPLDRNSVSSVPLMNEYDVSGIGNAYAFMQNDLVQLTEAYWRSQRRVGHLLVTNQETGKVDVHMVDETFDPKLFNIKEVPSSYKEHTEPDSICWVWVNQIWQGIKINENHVAQTLDTQQGRRGLYIDIRPCDFQFKGDVNPFNPKLPVCGGIFNNRNGRSMAVVDLIKPYQVLYNAIYNQAAGTLQRNNGKAFLMDINILPNLKDWGGDEAIEKFKSIMDATSLGIVDSSPVNTSTNGGSNFQHYQVVDLTETDKVQALFNMGQLVEEEGFYQLGITRQRQGQMQASSTAASDNAAISQSYAITETYFEDYYNYKRRAEKMHLDIAQFCASKETDITLPYITSDLGNAWVKVNGTELMLRDLGVNIVNSQEEQRIKQIAEQMALKNNQSGMPMSKILSLIRCKSTADMEKALQQGEADIAKQKQQEQEFQQQLQKQAEDAKQAAIDKQNTFIAGQNDLNRQKDIEVALLKSEGGAELKAGDEGVKTLAEQGKIALAQNKLETDRIAKQLELSHKVVESARKNQIDNKKLDIEKDLKTKELAHKSRELDVKKKIEDESVNIEHKRLEADLKLSKDEGVRKDKELKAKIQLEKIKIRNKPKTPKK